MKIAIVGSFDNYSHMGNWAVDAWEANGHEVTKIDRKKENPFDVGEVFTDGASLKYDVILYVDCSEDFSGNIGASADAIKVFWSLDAQMPGGAERSINIARKCDLVFSSNYEHGVKILEKFGIKSHLLPITYSDKLVNLGITKADKYDVAMIGNPNSPERKELWSLLNKKCKAFTGAARTAREYADVMTHSRIVVNQPTEPWDNILNNRFFEALGFDMLLLQKRLKGTNLIEKLGFIPDKDFVYWDNFEDLEKKLDKYLKEYPVFLDSTRKKIQQYSMRNQVAKMENVIISKFWDRL